MFVRSVVAVGDVDGDVDVVDVGADVVVDVVVVGVVLVAVVLIGVAWCCTVLDAVGC